MNITQQLRVLALAIGVTSLFSGALMAGKWLSIPPIFLGVNERFTYGIMGTVVAFTSTCGLLGAERKSWKDYGLKVDKLTLLRFLLGTFSALLVASMMFLLQVGYSDLQISLGKVNLVQFFWMSLSLLPLAFMQELAFRCYPLFKLHEAFGVWVAQFVMAVLFALYHYVGGWTILASFAGPGVWSFAYGLLAFKTKGIALPTGFHFGLNLALAAIGHKYWVPGLIVIDFAGVPTAEMLQSNEYFGVYMQLILFVTLLAFTYRYTKSIHGTK